MIKVELYTTESLISQVDFESNFDLCKSQLETCVESFAENCIEVSYERVLGFSAQIDIDAEKPQGDEDEESEYAPTPEHQREEVAPSASGERKKIVAVVIPELRY